MTVEDDLGRNRLVHRERRSRLLISTLIAAAAVAVVVVVGAVAGVGSDLLPADPAAGIGEEPADSRRTVLPTSGSPEPAEVILPDGAPPEEVWPEAVVTVPRKLDDGTSLEGLLFADRTTLVLRSKVDHERTAAFYAYDLTTREFRKITDALVPERRFSGGHAVAGDRLVWWVNTERYADGEVWAAPLAGGPPVRLAKLPRGAFGRVELVGDRLVYSLQGGDVLSLPLDGGTAAPVPGGQGLTLLEWPWAGTPPTVDGDDKVLFRHLVNLQTGETADAVVGPGDLYVQCGVTTCTGAREVDGGHRSFVRDRDGSHERAIQGLGPALAADRFQHLKEGTGRLVDLRTGKVADLGVVIPEVTNESFVLLYTDVMTRDAIAYWRGDELVFVDLRRIIAGS
uniref:hypothetical protein n=1 Tax=Herbidospora sakaeratensis TaxID=564415 RepID=UPI000781FFBE|nr:hypothetical protein [Herbidospora sakaeratensis]